MRKSNPKKSIIVGGIVLLIIGTLLGACQPEAVEETPAETRESPPQMEIWSPGPQPEGIAWDGTHLWVIDGQQRMLYKLDPFEGKPIQELEVAVEKPRSLAWDGANFWVVDEAEGLILRIDPETGEQVKSIPAPPVEVEGPWSYSGLTWDGEKLWLAVSAAWCSSVKCIDPESGEIVCSLFPMCDPRGLASDGNYLWMIAYNEGDNPSKIAQRVISKDLAEMAQSQDFIADIPVIDPGDMTFMDGGLWILDREEGRIFQTDIDLK